MLIRLTGIILIALLAACSGDDYIAGDSDAIKLAKTVDGVAELESKHSDFAWQVIMWCTPEAKCPAAVAGDDPKKYPVRVVCYCMTGVSAPRGWFIEANLSRRSAPAISGNAKLEKHYGFGGSGRGQGHLNDA